VNKVFRIYTQEAILKAVTARFESFTLQTNVGYYKVKPEGSIVIEIVDAQQKGRGDTGATDTADQWAEVRASDGSFRKSEKAEVTKILGGERLGGLFPGAQHLV
jgi:hypothetical protein